MIRKLVLILHHKCGDKAILCNVSIYCVKRVFVKPYGIENHEVKLVPRRNRLREGVRQG